METKENILKLIGKLFPELLPDCNVKMIPVTFSPSEFRQRLKSADNDSVVILTEHILGQNNEFLQGISNIMVSEIAARIKSAETLYAIEDNTLAKPYPHIASGNAVIFFDEVRATQFVDMYNQKHGETVKLLTLDKPSITDFFMKLTRFGVEFIEIEPTLCKIRYKQAQLIKTEFDSVSKPFVNYIMLRFLQLQGRQENPKVLKVLEKLMLNEIASATLACMGVTLNGNFEALLITDRRDHSKWIPCFTDTTEIQETYTTIPAIAKLMMTSQVVTISFSELEKYMVLDNVSGVVMNIGGFGMRLNKQTCIDMINAVKNKKQRGQNE